MPARVRITVIAEKYGLIKFQFVNITRFSKYYSRLNCKAHMFMH
jgi:hypothetical protein